jgi:hypothetical protein
MAQNDISAFLQLRELRQWLALKQLGYDRDVEFLEVIKDHIPALLNTRPAPRYEKTALQEQLSCSGESSDDSQTKRTIGMSPLTFSHHTREGFTMPLSRIHSRHDDREDQF